MIDKLRIGVATLSWVFWSCLTGTAVIGLTGCATNATGVASSGDFVTESDESDSHKRARLRLELAAAYFDKGQATDALDHLKQSIAADPNLFEAYNLRGLIYMRLNDLPLADESFRRALVINPKAASVQHNYGWMLCQQSRYPEAMQMFANALGNPTYGDRAKTWMAQGLCQQRGGQMADAENSLLRSYELDAGNPITAYNLSLILYQRGEFVRSQFYVRRLNNSELANSESLWLGIKVERRLENREAMAQLSSQLKKRFPQSREFSALERGAFNE
ncbi:type IV pilus biogenesis/stability protein PilW [Candidatus Aalborgicola defluviihabitans]|jgi:type IV pilus assembly protein PilF|uniref:type IV pilus biogenesis/stability protein PilW n=1 Tax=Candidatus Aalborgicola defluviihabitans TaxID=3386187 RepID=UPI001DF63891|nr:type IV pilus biogenesis/stability protein PilW [Burkholderiales bacterium]MBK7282103.1 type IV pilus biogenesis/stability protein PilW [Burkholderiales bacterium]MBL0244514.1 type IV pilus biogenesis/stability protein PilW [Rhodoferax sp.]